MQRGRGGELRAQVRRSVEQGPVGAIGRYCKARLRPPVYTRVAVPCKTAHRTSTIPLRIATAGRCTEHNGGQTSQAPPRAINKSGHQFFVRSPPNLKFSPELNREPVPT